MIYTICSFLTFSFYIAPSLLSTGSCHPTIEIQVSPTDTTKEEKRRSLVCIPFLTLLLFLFIWLAFVPFTGSPGVGDVSVVRLELLLYKKDFVSSTQRNENTSYCSLVLHIFLTSSSLFAILLNLQDVLCCFGCCCRRQNDRTSTPDFRTLHPTQMRLSTRRFYALLVVSCIIVLSIRTICWR